MYFDILQNPPIQKHLNDCLLHRTTQNISPIAQSVFSKNQKDLEILSQCFCRDEGDFGGGNFGFESGDFVELFLTLKNYHIGFAISNHQQAYQAYKLCKNICNITPIIPCAESAIISKVPKCDIYLIPETNQDLLTLNPLTQLKNQILKANPQALLIIDISYALKQGREIEIPLDHQTIFLCEGEALGFLRGYGIFLSSKSNFSLFPRTRYVDGFYEAFYQEVQRLKNQSLQDKKEQFFTLLKEKMGEDLSLFAPLKHCLPNALPLRFKGIRARNLLQSLYLDRIFAINGQECLFGFASPSFVLQEMGYTELNSRELLSISFQDFSISNIEALATHYQQIKTLEV